MKNVVITIGREYGSGGKYIGSVVAKKLGINFYDKELITKTYEKSGCNYSKLEEFDENKRNTFLSRLSTLNPTSYDDAYSDDLYQELIENTIKDLANTEDCVIIGRNSNKILKNYNNIINIFIYSNNTEFKVKRKMEIESISYEEALSRLKYIDKKRRRYYEVLNKNSIWGSKTEYDYLIDSSVLGIDKTIDLIVNIYNEFKQK